MRRWNAASAGQSSGASVNGRNPCVDSGHATRNRARKPMPRGSPPDLSKKLAQGRLLDLQRHRQPRPSHGEGFLRPPPDGQVGPAIP